MKRTWGIGWVIVECGGGGDSTAHRLKLFVLASVVAKSHSDNLARLADSVTIHRFAGTVAMHHLAVSFGDAPSC